MKLIANIEGEDVLLHEDGRITFKAKAAIDADGTGPHHGDPTSQSDTSLHLNGKPLNADEDIYIVVPPAILKGVVSIVLGCQALVHNLKNGTSTTAVVGDIGPKKKIGEISVACAIALGINSSPTKGGEDGHVIEYIIYPGQAAVVNGKQYKLQPLH
jgi:hypothetical protein